jgi:hypothetical protein
LGPAYAAEALGVEKSGCLPDVVGRGVADPGAVPHYRLHHRHDAHECRVVFAAWNGTASPLRHRATVASCASGGHEIWWDVDAGSEAQALGYLPRYVAERTQAIRVGEVQIP